MSAAMFDQTKMYRLQITNIYVLEAKSNHLTVKRVTEINALHKNVLIKW